jgi:hypothetical protein
MAITRNSTAGKPPRRSGRKFSTLHGIVKPKAKRNPKSRNERAMEADFIYKDHIERAEKEQHPTSIKKQEYFMEKFNELVVATLLFLLIKTY